MDRKKIYDIKEKLFAKKAREKKTRKILEKLKNDKLFYVIYEHLFYHIVKRGEKLKIQKAKIVVKGKQIPLYYEQLFWELEQTQKFPFTMGIEGNCIRVEYIEGRKTKIREFNFVKLPFFKPLTGSQKKKRELEYKKSKNNKR